jgi:hypothetical protein
MQTNRMRAAAPPYRNTAAPPAYRPFASIQRKVVAPPVYRPSAVPSTAQLKPTGAPPVYRPFAASASVQPKPAGPPRPYTAAPLLSKPSAPVRFASVPGSQRAPVVQRVRRRANSAPPALGGPMTCEICATTEIPFASQMNPILMSRNAAVAPNALVRCDRCRKEICGACYNNLVANDSRCPFCRFQFGGAVFHGDDNIGLGDHGGGGGHGHGGGHGGGHGHGGGGGGDIWLNANQVIPDGGVFVMDL